jgi:Flp pilus assembly protein TadG
MNYKIFSFVYPDIIDDIRRSASDSPLRRYDKSLSSIFKAARFDWTNRIRSEQASNLVEVSLLLPLLLVMIAGVVDLGRALYYSDALASAASAGAIYGSQAPTDITGMENTVDNDAAQVPEISAAASYGCECQDGSGKSASCSTSPSCSNGVVYYVTVTASSQFKPLVPWPGIPSSFSLSSSSTMRGEE